MNKQASFAVWIGLLLLTLSGCSELASSYGMQSHAACLKSGGSLSQKLAACDNAIRSRRYAGTRLAELYFMKGSHQQDAGRHTAAILSFQQALQQNPEDSKVYYYLSLSQLRLGQFAAAQHNFETAHRLN
jgi:lipoprotein NlpI